MVYLNRLYQAWNILSFAGTASLPESSAKRVVLTNRICLILGLLSVFFVFPWAAQGNLFMVSINLLLVLVYGGVIYLNQMGWYDIPKYLMIICVSTPIFVVTGMVGLKSHLHFSLIPVAGFSILLFDRKEKIKILFAIGYPLLLLTILLASRFDLFPNYMGTKLEMLPVYDYFLNFGIIFSTMFCFYRAYIRAEDSYQVLYEEHIKAQKLLDEERARAMHASKMAALGEMAGGVAHEIDSPLFVIRTLSYKIQSSLPKGEIKPEKAVEYANTINEMCTKISAIMRSLNSISRSGHEDPPAETNLKSLIEDTLVICRQRLFLKSVSLEVECPDHLKVICRPVEIGQILINLLNNAYDAVEKIDSPFIKLKVICNKTTVEVIVEDNGSGIPEHLMHKVFENYFTTKPPGKGTGLGLSISRRLAESNKGSLNYSRKAGNTQFVLSLPAA